MTQTPASALGLVFPGQGSQDVGMLADLAAANPLVRATFDEASAAIDLDLWSVSQQGPAEELNRTAVTQPALLSASVAVYRCWQDAGGPAPAIMAGHSLGEYSALVCAGALDFVDAVRLVRARGEFMQNAVAEGEGAMAAILGLDDDQIAACCAGAGAVSPANFNSPGQVVIAGTSAAVDAAIDACKAAGAKRAMRLAVSVPSHCSLMAPAAEQFAGVLAATAIQPPAVPVIQNVAGQSSDDPMVIRNALVQQLSSPVQWTRCVQAMASSGVTLLLECGPGKVLTGLTKRIDRSLRGAAMNSQDSLTDALAQAQEATA